jgi:hypothetical protein
VKQGDGPIVPLQTEQEDTWAFRPHQLGVGAAVYQGIPEDFRPTVKSFNRLPSLETVHSRLKPTAVPILRRLSVYSSIDIFKQKLSGD